MNKYIARLNNKDHVLRQAFKLHCESIAMGVAVHYTKNGMWSKVSTFEELSNDFSELPNDFKNQVIKKLVEINHVSKRKQAQKITREIFAVDNLAPNPETQHIFDDYANGKIATVEEAIQTLDKHYNVTR